MRLSKLLRVSAITAAIAGTAGTISCLARDETTAGPTPPEALAVAILSPDASARVALAKQRAAYIGETHSEMIRDVRNHQAFYLSGVGTGTVRQRRCAGLVQLVTAYGKRLDERYGLTRSESDARTLATTIMGNQPLCRGVGAASVFGIPLVPASARTNALASEDEVTGEFSTYLDALPSAHGGTDGTPNAVQTATDAVVASASSIPQPDLDVVAAGASVAVSSATEWQSVESSGGFDGAEYPPPPMTSLYMSRANALNPILVYLGVSDVAGCLVGAGASFAAGERRAAEIAGQCGWWALGASVGAYAGLFAT